MGYLIIITCILCLISFSLYLYGEKQEFERIGICPYCKSQVKVLEHMDKYLVVKCDKCNNYSSAHAWRKAAWREL